MGMMQRLSDWLYPPACLACHEATDGGGDLCGACWAETPFLRGLRCDLCGVELPGQSPDGEVHCDDCLGLSRPWQKGRAALGYDGAARRLVLGLKHGDRTDIAPVAARWMVEAGRDLLVDGATLVPVPISRWRLFRRRYNQSAELARHIGRLTGCDVVPDALLRLRNTRPQDGMTVHERFDNLDGAIALRSGAEMLAGPVVLIDDVMTSGATLSACARALEAAAVTHTSVLVLARVAKAP